MTNHLYDHLIAPHHSNDDVFLECSERDPLTYREFVRMSARLAHVLRASGFDVGDRIVVQAPKTFEMVALYAAALQAGGVFMPLNTAYKRDALAYFIADARPSVIVCDPASEVTIAELAEPLGAAVLTLDGDG